MSDRRYKTLLLVDLFECSPKVVDTAIKGVFPEFLNRERFHFTQDTNDTAFSYEKICDMLDITFGQINYIEINKFLQRNGIYTNKSMKWSITIIHWILVFIIYTSICYFKDISVILMVHGFIGIVLMGFFTNILFLTLLDSKIRTYRLDKKYRAIIAYRGRP